MLEIRPDLLLRVDLLERRIVSLKGRQRVTESGRNWARDGSSGQPELLGDVDRGAAQDLGVELVGAAHDLPLVLRKSGMTSSRGSV